MVVGGTVQPAEGPGVVYEHFSCFQVVARQVPARPFNAALTAEFQDEGWGFGRDGEVAVNVCEPFNSGEIEHFFIPLVMLD